jgi:CubicO group peptidase (beta-lactamase class C family)
LRSALDYIGDWLEFQVEGSQQPGCIIAVAHRGKVITEHAFGEANLDSGEKLTPRHRFRIASHSKAFIAAGLMKLRERQLDDQIGQYVKGLHPQVAEATIAQVLAHSAGLIRDGADAGQFIDSRPYLSEKELLAELRLPAAIAPNTRFKYSNHGFGLLGLVIEAIAGEPYPIWIKREIVEPAGLGETEPNMPIAKDAPFARGPLAAASARPAGRHSRRQFHPCHHLGRGFRQHGGGYRPLLRPVRAECDAERAVGREPAGDDAQAMANPADHRGGLLRVRSDERVDRRLGLVRP